MKNDACRFALSRDGKQIAVGDGPELLVYRNDGQPVWKKFCDDIVVGMAFVGAHLAVVDASGNLVFYSAPDGRKVEEQRIEYGTCHGAIGSTDGLFGVLTSNGIVLCESNGAQRPIPLRDLEPASFGPDRNSLALADRHGNLTAMDANTAAPWGSIALGAPIRDIAWCYQGFWLVTTGSALLKIDGGATQILGRTDLPGEAGPLAVSIDGAMAVVLMRPDKLAVIELHQQRHIGDIVFRREVHGIAFGGHALLGVGFDDGDANTIDLMTRGTIRTEPHPGRGRNNWNLDMQYDPAPLRGAVTYLRAGGSPIAEYQGFVEPDIGGDAGSNTGCKIAMLIFFMFFMGLTSCLTFLFVMRFAGYL